MTQPCAICGDPIPETPVDAATCDICAEDLLKVQRYAFASERFKTLARTTRRIALRCKDCGYAFSTTAPHLLDQRPTCLDCRKEQTHDERRTA